jgi:hypothetical protein
MTKRSMKSVKIGRLLSSKRSKFFFSLSEFVLDFIVLGSIAFPYLKGYKVLTND